MKKRFPSLMLAVPALLLLGGCAIEPSYQYNANGGGGYYSGQSPYGNADTVIQGSYYGGPWNGGLWNTWGFGYTGWYGWRAGWGFGPGGCHGGGWGGRYCYVNPIRRTEVDTQRADLPPPARIPGGRFHPRRIAPVHTSGSVQRRASHAKAESRSAPVRAMPVRSAPVRQMPVRRMPVRVAPVRSAPVRSPAPVIRESRRQTH